MSDKFFMPPEWFPHLRCWMAWPCRKNLWKRPKETCETYTAVAHAIREFEPVTMLVPPHLMDQAYSFLGSDIDLIEMNYHHLLFCKFLLFQLVDPHEAYIKIYFL